MFNAEADGMQSRCSMFCRSRNQVDGTDLMSNVLRVNRISMIVWQAAIRSQQKEAKAKQPPIHRGVCSPYQCSCSTAVCGDRGDRRTQIGGAKDG